MDKGQWARAQFISQYDIFYYFVSIRKARGYYLPYPDDSEIWTFVFWYYLFGT